MIPSLSEDHKFNITINTTEDCNLRCKYCYEVNKKPHSLPLDYAKKFIDRVIEDPDPCGLLNDPDPVFRAIYNQGIILDTIGGDSFMDPELLDEIYSYFIYKLFSVDTPNTKTWRNHFRFSISTNGTLFSNPKVRTLIKKYRPFMSCGVSIDGCPEIHDLNRVYADGRGSMDDILANWPFYQKMFPRDSKSTKSTCNRDSIPYLLESLKFMHETLGINYVNQNFIMEDTGCTKEDYELLDKELGRCVEYVLNHRNEIYWSMIDFDRFATAHKSVGNDWYYKGHCGSGCMPALGIDGKIYPCFRWLNHTQAHTSDWSVGDIWTGFSRKENFKRVREGAYRCNCTKEDKCKTCDCESSCSYCIGGCYSEFGDFIRTTYICEITKLQVKWARTYWEEYCKIEGLSPIDWEDEISIYKER